MPVLSGANHVLNGGADLPPRQPSPRNGIDFSEAKAC